MKFKDALTKMHIVEDEHPISTGSVPTPPPQNQAQVPNYVPASYTAPSVIGSADPDMVATLKNTVLSSSPIINKVMQNVELVKVV